MCGRVFGRFLRFFFYILAALPVLLWIHGGTPLWPQSSGPSSRSSGGFLPAWEELSSGFKAALDRHEETLTELWRKLKTSEADLQRLTPLYEQSLRQNELLKTYNSQTAERMQEGDEALAAAYKTADRKDKTILRLIIAVILLVIPYLIKLALWVMKKCMI
jgi:IS1 family transposase